MPTPARPRSFAEVLASAEALFATKSASMTVGDGAAAPVPMFRVNQGMALVKEHGERFRSLGATLFVSDHGFGREKDLIALAPTTDKFEVIRLIGSDAVNYGHDNAAVIAWLRDLDKVEPFSLTGAGVDFVEGYFWNIVRDPRSMAHRIYAFCPDFYDQGLGLEEQGQPEEVIAKYLATHGDFFFWWD